MDKQQGVQPTDRLWTVEEVSYYLGSAGQHALPVAK